MVIESRLSTPTSSRDLVFLLFYYTQLEQNGSKLS